MPYKLLLDCDPGLDDALALLLAHGDPNIELVGITTVGGNVALQNTTRNALQLREYLKFPKVRWRSRASTPSTPSSSRSRRRPGRSTSWRQAH